MLRVNRRGISLVLLACVVGGVLAACGQASGPVSSSTTPTGSHGTPNVQAVFRAALREAQRESLGEGVRLAILDAGVAEVAALEGRVTTFDCCQQAPTGDPKALRHGTALASLAAGRHARETRIGVAPAAEILSYTVIQGSTYNSNLVAQAIGRAAEEGADIVLLAFSTTVSLPKKATEPLRQAIARHPEILFVTAVGNDGAQAPPAERLPCGFPEENVLCVGTVTADGALADFGADGRSGYGDAVDLLVPEDRVLIGVETGGHLLAQGTSYSAAIVAGGAALALAASPNLKADGLVRSLRDSGIRGGQLYGGTSTWKGAPVPDFRLLGPPGSS